MQSMQLLLLRAVCIWICAAVAKLASAQVQVQAVNIAYNVTEHSPPETRIGNLTLDIYRQLRVTGGPPLSFILLQCTDKLSINPQGELIVIDDIDREFVQVLRCSVAVNRLDTANEKLSVPIPNFITVQVQVTDVNDEAPRWEIGDHFSIEFTENEIKTTRPIPLAIDTDATALKLSYNKTRATFANGTRVAHDPFQLIVGPANLLVSLNGRLDYESVPEYRFTIVAWDGRHNATLEIQVRVRDVNENAPQFANSSYIFSLLEDYSPYSSSSFAQLVATDLDGTDREEGLRYSIVPNSPLFEIDEGGYLKLTRELNYEQARQHVFTVIARDHGQLSASASVTVSVIDVNDVAPRLTGICKTGMCSSITVTEEDAPGLTDLKIYVSDEDSGRFGEVSCALSSDTDHEKFSLTQDGSSKVYVLSTRVRFDRERGAHYIVGIVCEDDGGAEKKTGELRVNVNVLDRNDCTPRLSSIESQGGSGTQVSMREGMHIVEVYENANIGSSLASLIAEDCDETGNPNSRVTFRLTEETVLVQTDAAAAASRGNSNAFTLSADGTLSLIGTLDREVASEYQLKVLLSDEGSPSLNSTSTIHIRLLDVVDSAPHFTNRSYRLTVMENVPVGHVVTRLSITDPDDESLNGLTFRIVEWPSQSSDSCVAQKHFAVDHTGVMRTLNEINREACSHFVFQVVATDSAGLRDTANVQLAVTDQNDNWPQFVFPNAHNNSVRIGVASEDLPLTRLLAIDADVNPDCPISYSLKSTTMGKEDLFYISEFSGEIRLSRPLSSSDSGQHRLTVEASDCGPLRHNVTQTLYVIIDCDVADQIDDVQLTTGNQVVQLRTNSTSNNDNFVLMVCLLSVFGCMIALALVALVVLCKRFATPVDDPKTRRRPRKRQNRPPRAHDLNNNDQQSTKMMLGVSVPSSASTMRKSASFARVAKCDASYCDEVDGENVDNEINVVVCEGCKLGTCEMADMHAKLQSIDVITPYSCKTDIDNSISEYTEDVQSEKNSPAAVRSKTNDGAVQVQIQQDHRCGLSQCVIVTPDQSSNGAIGSNTLVPTNTNINRNEISSPAFSISHNRIIGTDMMTKKRQLHTVPRRPFVNASACGCAECNNMAFSGMTLPMNVNDSWLPPPQMNMNVPVVVPLGSKQFDTEMLSFVPRAYETGLRPASRPHTNNVANNANSKDQHKDSQYQSRSSSVTDTQSRMKSFTKPVDSASYV